MRKRYLVLVALFFLAALFVLIARDASKKPNLVLEVAPDDAKIVLDDKEVISAGKHVIPLGKHTIVASLAGFASVSRTFTVTESGRTTMSLLLNPTSEVGYKYLRDNPEQQLRREALGGQSFDKQSRVASQKNPLINKLPFVDRLYRIDYGESPSESASGNKPASLYITLYSTDPAVQNDALEWIRFNGHDPAEFEIIYRTVDPNQGE